MATKNKNLSAYDRDKLPDVAGKRFGLVVSEWNADITQALAQGAKETLLDCGVSEQDILSWDVPGSFELPFGCKKMIQTQKVDAVIAIGSVIRGETSHFDFVCHATALGIKDLNHTFDVPTIFCVLTDNTLQQAKDRSGGQYGNKGTEAAIVAIKMAALVD